MNTTRETVEPAMREAAKDVCGEDMMDIIPIETRNLMGFYASLRKLLIEVSPISPILLRKIAETDGHTLSVVLQISLSAISRNQHITD